jgi:hypothetical protein
MSARTLLFAGRIAPLKPMLRRNAEQCALIAAEKRRLHLVALPTDAVISLAERYARRNPQQPTAPEAA